MQKRVRVVSRPHDANNNDMSSPAPRPIGCLMPFVFGLVSFLIFIALIPNLEQTREEARTNHT